MTHGCQDCAYEVGVPVPGPTGLCPKHANEQIDGRHEERRRRVEAVALAEKAVSRGVEFWHRVEEREAGWRYALECRQARIRELRRLRHAAPALLEALEQLVDHASETYPHFESPRGQTDIAQAHAAIKAAQGEHDVGE